MFGRALRSGVRLLFGILALLLLAAHSLSAQKTIVHWQHSSPAYDALIQELAQKFMEQNPDIKVEIEIMPLGTFLERVTVALAAGAGPDTVQIRSNWVQWLAAAGMLQPVQHPAIEEEFVPGPLGALHYNGSYYGYPTDAQTIVLFRQPELYDRAGLDASVPPATWEELIEQARKIHRVDSTGKTEIMGVATGGYSPVLYSLMIQAGADFWDEEAGLPRFNTPEAARALYYATDLVTRYGVEDPAFGSRWTAFRNERLGMVYAHPAMKGSFLSTHPNLKFHISEVPAPEPGGSQETLITNWALAISHKADPEPANRWLYFLQSTESQRLRLERSGELPTRWDLVRDPDLLADPDMNPVLWSMIRSHPVPWTSDDMLGLIERAYRSVIQGVEPVETALENLQHAAVVAEQEARKR